MPFAVHKVLDVSHVIELGHVTALVAEPQQHKSSPLRLWLISYYLRQRSGNRQ
jgi:hypothetical protein